MGLSNLEKAEKERDGQKTQAAWLKTKITATLDLVDVEHYLTEAISLKESISDTYGKIVMCSPADVDPYKVEYLSQMDDVTNLICDLKRELVKLRPVVTPAGSSKTPSTQIRLPQVDLPQFHGSLNEWISFRDLFKASVHNNVELSKAHKFSYLRSCIKGDAAKILGSMQCTDDNYETAWDLLTKRYENECELFFTTLQRFTGQPTLSTESASGLRSLLDVSKECIRALENLKVPVDQWDGILVFHMFQKLDSSSRRSWELSRKDCSIPKLKDFQEFVEKQARALAAGGLNKVNVQPKQDAVKKSSVHHVRGEATARKCKFCPSDHYSFQCPDFGRMSVEERKEALRKQSLCFNCLRGGHRSKHCNSERVCSKCKARHHTLVHTDASSGPAPSTNTHHSNGESEYKTSLLATAMVRIPDQHGQLQPCRALLDGGSNSSFISESCVQRLGLKRRRTAVEIVGIGSATLGTARGSVSITIHPHFPDVNETSHHVTTLVLPKVTGRMPSHPCDASSWPHLQGLLLADPSYHKPGEVELLLGADIFWDLLRDGKKKGSTPGSPVGLRSDLGWLIAGNMNNTLRPVVTAHYAEASLDETLQKFWELEAVPASRVLTREEKMFEQHFASTTTRDETGRFVVRLPVKKSSPSLGDSRAMAVRRLIQLEKRLARNVSHCKDYNEFLEDYESLGHMQLVSQDSVSEGRNPTYYIPHHFVLKESSTTTKFRVVFDASAKTSTGVSLNDTLMVGPTIQDSLFSILVRFRTHPIALTADIAKMYRQVRVSSPDTDLQRILWRKDPNGPISEYRLLTATYGTASAPYHATKCLNTLAEQEKTDLPLAASVVIRDFYVDDLMSGAPSVSEALALQSQLVEMMKRGGLDLRKWSSNSAEVLESLPQELRETQVPLKLDVDDVIKALGLLWNPGLDVFTFKVQLPAPRPNIRRRILLSEMAKVFDPLGFLAPVLIRAKILFQQLWRPDLGWDDVLPQHLQNEWALYRTNLTLIENVSISRCFLPEGAKEVHLHGFCDASERAYAAAVYLRVRTSSGKFDVSLVAAKTRVAPSKQISLPRLELCGAYLLFELIQSIQASLNIKIDGLHAWTDSTIVLAWIRAHPSRWKTFVANRVAQIQEIIPSDQWSHVSGLENPADCASRGIDPSELSAHPLWWRGPRWLGDEDPRPFNSSTSLDVDSVSCEERVVVHQVSVADVSTSLLYKVSSLRKLKTVTAWLLRCVHNVRVKIMNRDATNLSSLVPRSGPVAADELDEALLRWVRLVQSSEFSSEIDNLTQERSVSSTSKLRALNPFLDPSRLLRVGGRLSNASVSFDKKYPILLPRHSRLTELLIQDLHIANLHAGPQLIHSILHRRFWVIGAKDAIRHQTRKCVVCARYRKSTLQQFMGDLPAFRVNPARVFVKCGVDYAGPFTVRAIPGRSKVTFKAYLALFVCLTTRALHLEVVSALTTDAFLAALRRFIGRRGKPSDISSDCGTNFVGADRELKELHALLQSQPHNCRLTSNLANDGIRWHFNPPGAPHFGGVWEAGVNSVKHHLHRVVGATRLTFEELTTLMVQIEACLNSRPLTPVSTDPNDLTALTPGHFIIGESLTAIPEPDITAEKINRLTRWKLLQQMYQHFWRRWSGEFLTRLQQRPKWLQHRSNLKVGDLVLIKEENQPPLHWRMGRVIIAHPGADGLTRVVTLKTADGEMKRPVVKLCLLPIDSAIMENEDTM